MSRIKLHDPELRKGPMRVAGFMSGSGTNIIKIIENERKYKKEGKISPYEVVFLFSDRTDFKKCRISEISNQYDIPFHANNIREFYRKRGYKDRRNMEVRREYDRITLKYLEKYQVDCVALCGYMSIVTDIIFDRFPTINVHPADLSILTAGKRKYKGEHAVRDAILAGEKFLASSTHLATVDVDGGPLLIISTPLEVKLPSDVMLDELKREKNEDLLNKIADSHQDKLKQIGDWVIFPKVLEFLAQGLVEKDEKKIIYIKGSPAPLRL